jgi:hypothetical protein
LLERGGNENSSPKYRNLMPVKGTAPEQRCYRRLKYLQEDIVRYVLHMRRPAHIAFPHYRFHGEGKKIEIDRFVTILIGYLN